MARAQGYAIITDPDAKGGVALERDTITCAHCQTIVFIKPGSGGTVYLLPGPSGTTIEEMGAGCYRCHAPVCLGCYHLGVCTPWERQMERLEARDRLRRAVDR